MESSSFGELNSVLRYCVKPDSPLKEVLNTLETVKERICIVTNAEEKVVGTITDGDCRRALLRGETLSSPAAMVMKKDFFAVDSSFSPEQVRSLMRINDLRQVPVVDSDNRLLAVHSLGSLQTKTSDNAAFILAGGRGERLKPLTNTVPKPMLPVGGRPMLEILIEQLVSQGIKKIFIAINYLGDIIEKHFQDGKSFWLRNYLYQRKESIRHSWRTFTFTNKAHRAFHRSKW